MANTVDVQSMAVNMFLGVCIGNWTPVHVPTTEDPSLTLMYSGKEKSGRIFKFLNAVAKSSKKTRPTKYWSKIGLDTEKRVIVFCHVKDGVKAEDIIENFNKCLQAAKDIEQFRVNKAQKAARPVDENKSLRKQANKLARELLGPDTKLSVSKSDKGLELTLRSLDDHYIVYAGETDYVVYSGRTERELYLNVIADLAVRCK